MGKRIFNALGWSVTVFIVMSLGNYFSGNVEWLSDTINWIIPSGFGFFCGYWQAQRDQKREWEE